MVTGKKGLVFFSSSEKSLSLDSPHQFLLSTCRFSLEIALNFLDNTRTDMGSNYYSENTFLFLYRQQTWAKYTPIINEQIS